MEYPLQIKMSSEDRQALASMRSMQDSIKQFGQNLLLVAGPIAATATAIVKLGASFADQVEALDNLSVRSKVSTRDLEVLQAVFKAQGESADGLGQSLSFLNRAIAKDDEFLRALGVTTRDTYQAFLQVAEGLGRSSDQGFKTEAAMSLLGRSGSALLPVMDGLATKTRLMADDMARLGGITGETGLAIGRQSDAVLDRAAVVWDAWGKKIREVAAAMIVVASVVPRSIATPFGFGDPNGGIRGGGNWGFPGSPGEAFGPNLPPVGSDAWKRIFGGGGGGGGGGGWRGFDFGSSRFDTGAGAIGLRGGASGALVADRQLEEIGLQFEKTFEKIADAGERFRENAYGTFKGAFDQILGVTTTSTSVVVRLFVGLANSVIEVITDMLARLAARGVAEFAVGVVGSLIGIPLASGGLIPEAGAPQGGVVFNVNALDVRSFQQAATSVFGSVRSAERVSGLRRSFGR